MSASDKSFKVNAYCGALHPSTAKFLLCIFFWQYISNIFLWAVTNTLIHSLYGISLILTWKLEDTPLESELSFNNGDIYLEKYINKPRHIEIQILADIQGNVIGLGERECTIQRRYQKILDHYFQDLL